MQRPMPGQGDNEPHARPDEGAPYRAPLADAPKPAPRRTGASRHEAMRYVAFGGLAFGVVLGVIVGLASGSWTTGFHTGFFSGFLFGLALKAILGVSLPPPAPMPRAPLADEPGFEADEMIVFVGPANHFKGVESVGGKLFLTDRRLRFRSHSFNVQTHDESYPLASVSHVEPARTLGIVPNGLLVHLREGRRERFVVMSRAGWIDAIRRSLG